MKLIEGFDSNYRYILVAARRARQLQSRKMKSAPAR
jgi:DNA-directed RNA polymerase omega subunit